MILELQAGQDGCSAKAEEEGEHMGLDGEEEDQEVVKEEEEGGQVATDSDSGVVVGEGGFWLEAGVGRSVSGVMARQEQASNKQLSKSRAELEGGGKRFDLETAGVKRVYINHRSVTRVRDLKYRRITRTKARSMEELREKLREGPLFTKEEGFSHA